MKSNIKKYWTNSFLELNFFTPNKLYKICGPLIIGFDNVTLPGGCEYRPHFVIYSLWKNNLKSCLEFPIILNQFYDKKGFQIDISFEANDLFYEDLLLSIKKQLRISFEGDVSLKKVIEIIDDYSKTSHLSAAPNSYLQAILQESKLMISLFNSKEEAIIVLNNIQKHQWDLNSFKMWEVDFNKWILSLHNQVENRESFLNQINLNKQDKKIAKLIVSELII